VLLTALLVGTVQAQDEMDPWEGYNRWMFEFNDASDRILIKPVARGYDAIMPEPRANWGQQFLQ
jgi:phospholipid-binding lipoprotein MlaA